MRISAIFIQRPIATTLLAIGLGFAGIFAFNSLPIASLPQVDFPTIAVSASLPGASPENMATSVASPLERQLGRIAGITQMTSSSVMGLSQINLQFDLSRNINGAARSVQSAINASLGQLPPNLPNNPFYRKINAADPPILILSMTSQHLKQSELYDVASSFLQQKISQISGVGQVFVGGSSLPAVRIDLNPTTLNSYGISLPTVAAVIAAANVNQAKGQIPIAEDSLSDLLSNDQIFKASHYAPLIIAYRNNSPVRISDVARVHDSVQDVRNAGISGGKPAVLMVVFKEPGANVISTVDRVKATLPELKSAIPATIDLEVVVDRTKIIRASLHDVEFTLIIAMLLVILVTYLFLGNVRAMLIPGVAVPLSILGTFAVMKLLGYSLNNLSLMALTISTGFVVDDAVVVLENISRHLEMGKNRLQAALDGAKEVNFTVISMSISLIAVFIPILFMGGLVGRLFREFAVSLSTAIFISMIISLTVTPMMCSRLLKVKQEKNSNSLMRFMSTIHHGYGKSLAWSLNHSRLMQFLTLLMILLTVFLFIIIPKGFFPQQDTGQLNGTIQTDQSLSFQATNTLFNRFVKILREDPAVANITGFIGGSNRTSQGAVYVTLKAPKERQISADQVINRLRPNLANVRGARLLLQSAQDLTVGSRQASGQYQFTISADKFLDLKKWSTLVYEKMSQLPGIVDLNSDERNHGLQIFVEVNRDLASGFGISLEQIDQTLYNAFGQSLVSTMYTAMNQYYVVMGVAPEFWQRPETLNEIYVISATGAKIPLSAFARFSPSSAPLAINHQGQAPAVTFSFNLLPGTPLDQVVKSINSGLADLGLPRTIQGTFQGTAQAFQDSLADEPYLILAALLAVYIVLGMLYESLIHPITILSTLPSAGVGALLALLLSRTDFSIIALIGVILLIGIVKKNAIMMIDFALEVERKQNKSPRESIYEAALLRFRPIMMTTMAAMFGALPLVFGMGIGSELRRPLGIAIVGGLVVSQLLTLYTTPVIYLAMENVRIGFHRFIADLKNRKEPSTKFN
ncbi:MAG: efflux RND transporter permease subunit [Tatlockia sp.]|nr:efflux RND transporter permease subunit [Tatlockia sp.]